MLKPLSRTALNRLTRWLSISCLAFLTGCSGSDPATPTLTSQPMEARQADQIMIAAAHPLAVEAGLEVLREGGHAVDAAIAVQMVLGFIESPETGLGGGGFLLLHQADYHHPVIYDGRETAPAAAQADRFQWMGMQLPLAAAIPSGASIGVPGLVSMLAMAHKEHGRLPWARLLAPAIKLADEGLPMPLRLQKQIASDASLRLFSDTRSYYRQQAGAERPRLQNPALAATLRQLAEQGPQAFYQGPIAEKLIERVTKARWGGSDMTITDLNSYTALKRDAVCAPYREWTLCGAPPPSSGGITVLQIMGILEHFDLGSLKPGSPEALHLVSEASRLAFADRNSYIGDPDFVEVPTHALLDRDYLQQRALLINPQQALANIHPGEPGKRVEMREFELAPDAQERGTSHFSIVDAQGNLLALTSSNEAPFGSRMLSQGFVLNNQLTDFSFDPQLGQKPHPNAVAGGKRPRSSMAPIVVLDANGEPRLVIGSRGGSRIIGYLVKALIGVLDWELDVQDAIALPNHLDRGLGLEIEAGTVLEQQQSALTRLGHKVQVVPMTSGLHGIERVDGRWRGAADPRLDGVALGE
ncbi:gamma-glutamyltransferase [Halopseudomonas pelagia]|uniref:gamma-glutamyltransferase n=1 Tax=Halopseudomonas pelagia TaxID=553151 RepID=UPI0030D9E6D3|tara:strand:+ start:92480 stop:94231 length:1752 start_codon:yes stop_codon:yes gene_type:complete